MFEFCSWFLEYWVRRTHPFLPTPRAMRFGHMVWVKVMVIFRWPYFNLVSSRNPWRWVVVVSWLNDVIIAVDIWGSSIQHLVKHAVNLMLGSAAVIYIHHATFHGFKCLTCWCKKFPYALFSLYFFLSPVSPIPTFFLSFSRFTHPRFSFPLPLNIP